MGHSIEEVWKRLLNGESGIARTTLFDATTFPTSISAEVKGFKLADHISDLAKHKDHTVRLTGKKSDEGGKSTLTVSKIEMVSASCR